MISYSLSSGDTPGGTAGTGDITLKSFENLFKFKLIPSDCGPQPSEFPLAIDLVVEMLDHCMSMSLVLHRLLIESRIALMGGPQLMMANDFVVGYLLPFGRADMVLGMHQRVTHKADMAHDSDEFFGRHFIPLVTVDLGVIHLEGGMVINSS